MRRRSALISALLPLAVFVASAQSEPHHPDRAGAQPEPHYADGAGAQPEPHHPDRAGAQPEVPAKAPPGVCADTAARPGLPSRDLFCIELVPAPGLEGSRGWAELLHVPSPFGVAVTPDGAHLYDVRVTVENLPAPSMLGPHTTYVAWVVTPLLRPVARLGEVGAGKMAVGRVGEDKFIVLVSAEPSAAVAERTGRLVLRGMSASMRKLPHDGEPLLLIASETPEDAGAHASHGTPAHAGTPARPAARHDGAVPAHGGASEQWTPPPMHDKVPMPPGMHALRPSVAPYLPDHGGAARLPEARPAETLRLADGATIDLEAVPVRRTIGGRTIVMYGFNGQYPGPLLRVEQGATVVVNFTNRTSLPTAVHWHGLRLDNRFDGVPHVTQEPVPPGGSFRYRVRFPDPGIYWYHPHHREDIQQDLGLYGNMLVDAPRPDFFSPVNREEILLLDDLLLDETGLVPFGRETATHALNGRFGNVFLVNGEPDWRLTVRRGDVVRFFITNVASTRTFNLSIGGARLKVVGSDGGKFEREEWVETVVIAPAERYIVEALFDAPGEFALTNRVRGLDPIYGHFFPDVDTLGVISVAKEATSRDFSAAFRTLRRNDDVRAEMDRLRPYADRTPDRALVLTMTATGLPFPIIPLMRMDSAYFHPVEWAGTMPDMNWVSTAREVRWILREPITGRENEGIQWRFRLGDVVKLRITNEREAFHAMQHPIHVHGQRFVVLSVDGTRSENLVWKDTFLLPVGSTADILLEVSNPGRWMLHCHIAEHLEAGMKMIFEVTR